MKRLKDDYRDDIVFSYPPYSEEEEEDSFAYAMLSSFDHETLFYQTLRIFKALVPLTSEEVKTLEERFYKNHPKKQKAEFDE